MARAKEDAEEYAVEMRRKLTETLARRTKQAEQKIAQAEATAVKDVRAIAVELAIAAATGLLKTGAAGKAGESLIAESIAAVKSRLN